MTTQSNASNPEVRKTGLGGSDCAVILGMSPWKTRYELYLEKTGEREAPDLSSNESVYWGTVHEEAVAKRYAERMDCKVRRNNRTLRLSSHPFMMAHIDREVVGKSIGLECKTADSRFADQWGDEFTSDIPEYYLLQCLHYLCVTGYAEWHLAVLVGGNRHRIYIIKRQDFGDEIDQLPEVELEFWQRVQDKVSPDPETLGDIALRWPKDTGTQVQASPSIVAAVTDLVSVRERKKALEEQEKELRFVVLAALGEGAELLQGDTRLLTYKAQTTRRIDTERLKAEYPIIAAALETETTSRVLRFPPAKKEKK